MGIERKLVDFLVARSCESAAEKKAEKKGKEEVGREGAQSATSKLHGCARKRNREREI